MQRVIREDTDSGQASLMATVVLIQKQRPTAPGCSSLSSRLHPDRKWRMQAGAQAAGSATFSFDQGFAAEGGSKSETTVDKDSLYD